MIIRQCEIDGFEPIPGDPGRCRWCAEVHGGGGAPVVLLPADAPREDWLAERRHGVGSSDAPIILGLTSWSSRVRLHAEKTGKVGESFTDTEKTAMGRRMEPVILELLVEALEGEGHKVEGGLLDGRLIKNQAKPWLRATCDAAIQVDGLGYTVEVKNSDRWEDWSEGPPPAYAVQCQHQMAVTGQARMLLCVLVRGWMLRWCWVDFDADLWVETIEPELAAFWTCVQTGDLPPIDASAETRKTLAQLFPASVKGEEVSLGGEWIDRDRQLVTLQATASAALDEVELIKNELRAEIGDAEAARLPNGVRWTWKGKNGRRQLRRQEARD